MKSLVFALFLLTVGTSSSAQTTDAGVSAPSGPQPGREGPSRKDERPIVWPTVRFAAPEGLSAGVSVQPRLPGPLNRMILSGTVGRNGKRLAVGYGWFGSDLMGGYGLQAVLLRTGEDPIGSAPHQTYLGVEGTFMLANISVRRGIAFRVGGRAPTEDWVVMTLSVGFGF